MWKRQPCDIVLCHSGLRRLVDDSGSFVEDEAVEMAGDCPMVPNRTARRRFAQVMLRQLVNDEGLAFAAMA